MNEQLRTCITMASCALALCACGGDDSGGGTAAGSGGVAGSAGTGATPTAATGVAAIAGFGTGTVTGSATFVQNGTDVTVTVVLANCPDGPHPVHVHEGTSCADATVQGAHWGPTRGEGIPVVACSGNTGTVMYTRTATPAETAWSVGGDATTNVVGHAFVVHDMTADPPPRIGCGVITAQ